MHIERKVSKYRAIKTNYGGYNYASKLEASQAYELDIRLKAGEIAGWSRQFKVEMPIYNKHGELVHTVNHKVDFRVEELDGCYTLIETKGLITSDYVFRRNLLEKTWLPEHLDYSYLVVKEKSRAWR
jgi:hypothetical protein